MRIYQDSSLEIAKDSELTQTDHRVYHALIAHTDFENKILISQYDLEKEIGIAQSNISVSIKRLCQKGVIIQTGNIGKQKIYHLHTDFGWKGRATRLANGIKAIENGQAPGKRSFAVTEFAIEDLPGVPNEDLVETLSKQSDVPTEYVERLLSILASLNQEE